MKMMTRPTVQSERLTEDRKGSSNLWKRAISLGNKAKKIERLKKPDQRGPGVLAFDTGRRTGSMKRGGRSCSLRVVWAGCLALAFRPESVESAVRVVYGNPRPWKVAQNQCLRWGGELLRPDPLHPAWNAPGPTWPDGQGPKNDVLVKALDRINCGDVFKGRPSFWVGAVEAPQQPGFDKAWWKWMRPTKPEDSIYTPADIGTWKDVVETAKDSIWAGGEPNDNSAHSDDSSCIDPVTTSEHLANHCDCGLVEPSLTADGRLSLFDVNCGEQHEYACWIESQTADEVYYIKEDPAGKEESKTFESCVSFGTFFKEADKDSSYDLSYLEWTTALKGSKKSDENNNGAIIGIVFSILVLALVAGIGYLRFTKSQQQARLDINMESVDSSRYQVLFLTARVVAVPTVPF